MPDELKDLVENITRGFAGLGVQIRERDDKVVSLSEKMVGVELKLDQLKETLTNRNDTERLAGRVGALEESQKETRIKQGDNAKWIKALLASVILLLLGFLLNFIRIGIK